MAAGTVRRNAPRLLLSTGNRGKLREMRRALAGAPVQLLDFGDLGRPSPEEPEETGEDFLANAGIKALHYQAATGIPSLAEDSGLEVDALDGGPGVRSARWLGRDTAYSEKNRRLLELLAARPDAGRGARYRSAVAIAVEGRIVFRSTGVVEGRIAAAARGDGGFGYDPVFFVPACGRTMAELDLGEKERISHRGRALRPAEGFLRAALMAEPPIIRADSRGVAQSGSAPALGAGSRRFKSSRPDHRAGRIGETRFLEVAAEAGSERKRGSASSSAGQSGGLLSRGSGVRILPGAPAAGRFLPRRWM